MVCHLSTDMKLLGIFNIHHLLVDTNANIIFAPQLVTGKPLVLAASQVLFGQLNSTQLNRELRMQVSDTSKSAS